MKCSFTSSPNLLHICLLCYWLFLPLHPHSSPWVKLPALLNRSSKQCFRCPWCFHLPQPVRLYQLLRRPLHFCILHPLFCLLSLLFPLFGCDYAALDSSLSPFCSCVDRVRLYSLCVWFSGRYAPSTSSVHALLLISPFPLLLSSPPPSSSLLFADRPVHCSTSFPLWQRSTSFCIHAAAAYAITILGPSATYSEAIQMRAVWHVLSRKWKCVFRC